MREQPMVGQRYVEEKYSESMVGPLSSELESSEPAPSAVEPASELTAVELEEPEVVVERLVCLEQQLEEPKPLEKLAVGTRTGWESVLQTLAKRPQWLEWNHWKLVDSVQPLVLGWLS